MSVDLVALDNTMLREVSSHYKKDASLAIDSLPKTEETNRLAQIIFARLSTRNTEVDFCASLVIDSLSATWETHQLSQTLFSSEEDIAMNEDPARIISHLSFFPHCKQSDRQISQEVLEKYFLLMTSFYSKSLEKCHSLEMKEIKKALSLVYSLNKKIEKEDTSPPVSQAILMPSSTITPPTKTCASKHEEQLEKEIREQRELLLKKMQCKEKACLKKERAFIEKNEKQKELPQTGRIFKNIGIIKGKDSEVRHENHYRVERETKDQENNHGNQQQGQQQKNPQKETRIFKITRKIVAITYSSFHAVTEKNISIFTHYKTVESNTLLHTYSFTQANVAEYGFPQKYQGIPLLSLPQMGIVCLYYILTKLNIVSEALSQEGLQQQIKEVDYAMTERKKMRLKDMEKAIFAEKSVKNWGIGTRMTSWLASFAALLGGISLIASGGGALVGGILVALGVINITSEVLEITDGWKKIAEEIGGDDPVKTRAMIMWIQIGIAIISFVLMGTSAIFGGITPLKDACTTASGFFTAVASIGVGVVLIGKALAEKKYYNYMAAIKQHDFYIEQYRHEKENLMTASTEGMENIQSSFEDLARALALYHQDVRRISAAMA